MPSTKLDKACTKMKAIYPAYFEWEFGRPDPGTFEMKVHRCFFHDFFARRDAEIVTTIMCAFDKLDQRFTGAQE
jgi:hypothetical protein